MNRKLGEAEWQRIETLFHQSASLPPIELNAFLERECDDIEVRKEIESLLRSGRSDVASRLGAVNRVSHDLIRSTEPVSAGMSVAGYKVVREIGRGGSGIVFLGEREQISFVQRVAIKVLPGATINTATRDRFVNEARIMASLTHKGIAHFLDSGATAEGVPYVIMEYIDGVALDRYCEAHRLDVAGRVSLVLSVCGAVQHAHDKRIIHRDIKPNNILVLNSGAPRLVDFGIAKLVRPEQKLSASTTVTRMMTPRYASPEQLTGGKIGTPSDIYSLGLVLYRLLTGGLPFGDNETSPEQLAQMIEQRDPPPPSFVSSDQSMRGQLDRIVLRALRRKPEDRHRSAEALAAELNAFLIGGTPG